MSSTLRRIDQLTLVLAPVATGQVMTYAGLENGALFIGGWNLGSLVLEYYLLWKVYTTVPALRMDKHAASQDNSNLFFPSDILISGSLAYKELFLILHLLNAIFYLSGKHPS